jgi:hypothetical protein
MSRSVVADPQQRIAKELLHTLPPIHTHQVWEAAVHASIPCMQQIMEAAWAGVFRIEGIRIAR